MSNEGFLSRWSRLKTEQQEETPPPPEPIEAVQPEETEAEEPAVPPGGAEDEGAEPPAELPSLESLGADSDYTPFLSRAVPAATRVAALRTAWRTDPKIAGFKGLADYDWDYNAPGYGQLLPTDDIRAMCDRLLGHLDKKDEEDGEGEDAVDEAPEHDEGTPPDDDAPVQA